MLASFLALPRLIIEEKLEPTALERLALFVSGQTSPVCVVIDKGRGSEWEEAVRSMRRKRRVLVLERESAYPSAEETLALANAAARDRPELVVGLGSGEALETAKGLALLIANGGDLEHYTNTEAQERPEKRGIKLVLIPTEPSGVECAPGAGFSSRSGGRFHLGGEALQADAVLLCAALVEEKGLPASFAALALALDALWSKAASPASDAIAQEALIGLLQGLRDVDRSRLLEASAQAGIASSLSGAGALSAFAGALGAAFGLGRAQAASFAMEDMIAMQARDGSAKKKLARVATALVPDLSDEETDEALSERLIGLEVDLKARHGMPSRFAQLGAEPEEALLASIADTVVADTRLWQSACEINKDQAFFLLKKKVART